MVALKFHNKSRLGHYRSASNLHLQRKRCLWNDANVKAISGVLIFNTLLLLFNSHPIIMGIKNHDNKRGNAMFLWSDMDPVGHGHSSEHHAASGRDDDTYDLDQESLERDAEEDESQMPVDAEFQSKDVNDCDMFLGNGLDTNVDYICAPWDKRDSANRLVGVGKDQDPMRQAGDIKCQWHPLLQSSFCQATNLMVDPSKIKVSRGGEPILLVQGRNEEDEMPVYISGAFQISQCTLRDALVSQERLPYHLYDMMHSVRDQEDDERSLYGGLFGTGNVVCSSYEDRPTLIITRYEYANLYHTYTDWYSAYHAAMLALDGNQEAIQNVNLVFFDGHAQGALDFGWNLLFRNATVSYLSEYQQQGSASLGVSHAVCFRRAIFVPPGYRAPVSVVAMDEFTSFNGQATTYMTQCGQTKWHRRFRGTLVANSKHHLASSKAWLYEHYEANKDGSPRGRGHWSHYPRSLPKHAITSKATIHGHLKKRNHKPKIHLRVLLISRQHYQAHPRTDGLVTRIMENEDELMNFLAEYKGPWDPLGIASWDFPTISVKRVVLEEHDISEQIIMFQQANIVVGMHGAGLSHILLARPGTMLIELQPPQFVAYMHFEYLANIAGCLYRAHNLRLDSRVDGHDKHTVSIQDFEPIYMESVTRFLEHHDNREDHRRR